MIVLVKEWIDSHEHQTFLLDTAKLDPNQPFEAAYLSAVQATLECPDKNLEVPTPGTPLEARFSNYQDSLPAWEKLKVIPPCQVDAQIELDLT